jgi:hypothetical protein
MTITNKTHRPLRVPLSGSRTLHLGPGKTGQISPKDAEDPRLKKLVEQGAIEIIDQGTQRTPASGNGPKDHRTTGGHGRSSGSHRSGDR